MCLCGVSIISPLAGKPFFFAVSLLVQVDTLPFLWAGREIWAAAGFPFSRSVTWQMSKPCQARGNEPAGSSLKPFVKSIVCAFGQLCIAHTDANYEVRLILSFWKIHHRQKKNISRSRFRWRPHAHPTFPLARVAQLCMPHDPLAVERRFLRGAKIGIRNVCVLIILDRLARATGVWRYFA